MKYSNKFFRTVSGAVLQGAGLYDFGCQQTWLTFTSISSPTGFENQTDTNFAKHLLKSNHHIGDDEQG